jgi:hypothetical protein
MKQGIPIEANSHLDEIPSFLQNTKLHYLVHQWSPLEPIQMS